MDGLMRPDTLTPQQEQASPTLTNVGGASLPRVLLPTAPRLPTVGLRAPGKHRMDGLMRPDTLTPQQEQASPTLTNVGGASLPRVLLPTAPRLPRVPPW